MVDEAPEPKAGRSGRKGCCLFGCLGAAFALVAGMLACGTWASGFFRQFGVAAELREQREELLAQRPFTPAADGRVRPERLEAYLRVRVRGLDACSRMAGFFSTMKELELREDEGEEVGFMEGLGVAGAALQLPGLMAEYFEARNRALLEEEMGLDEYRWYTVLAYRSGGGRFVREGAAADRPNARGNAGDQELVRRLFARQLEAARTAGAAAVGEDWLAALEAEAARLDSAERPGWPWAGGLPERVAESLAPGEELLRSTHCEAGEEFELEEVHREGMSVRVH